MLLEMELHGGKAHKKSPPAGSKIRFDRPEHFEQWSLVDQAVSQP